METVINFDLIMENHKISKDDLIECFEGVDIEDVNNLIKYVKDNLLKLFNSKDIKDRFKIRTKKFDIVQMIFICESICGQDIDGIIFVEDSVSNSYFQFMPYTVNMADKYDIDGKTQTYLLDNLCEKAKTLHKSRDICDSFELSINNVDIFKLEFILEGYCREPVYDIIKIEEIGYHVYRFSPY